MSEPWGSIRKHGVVPHPSAGVLQRNVRLKLCVPGEVPGHPLGQNRAPVRRDSKVQSSLEGLNDPAGRKVPRPEPAIEVGPDDAVAVRRELEGDDPSFGGQILEKSVVAGPEVEHRHAGAGVGGVRVVPGNGRDSAVGREGERTTEGEAALDPSGTRIPQEHLAVLGRRYEDAL